MRVSRRNPVLGINRRNIDYVLELNPRARFPLADDKILCKEKLCEAGFPVPETRSIVRDRREIEAMLGVGTRVLHPRWGEGEIRERTASPYADD